MLPAAANRQPALAAHFVEWPGDPFVTYGVIVFALERMPDDEKLAGREAVRGANGLQGVLIEPDAR